MAEWLKTLTVAGVLHSGSLFLVLVTALAVHTGLSWSLDFFNTFLAFPPPHSSTVHYTCPFLAPIKNSLPELPLFFLFFPLCSQLPEIRRWGYLKETLLRFTRTQDFQATFEALLIGDWASGYFTGLGPHRLELLRQHVSSPCCVGSRVQSTDLCR